MKTICMYYVLVLIETDHTMVCFVHVRAISVTILRKYANCTALCSAIRQTQGVCIHIHIHSDTHADLSRFVHVRAHKQLWMRAPLCMCIQERIRGIMGKHKDNVPYLCMVSDICSLCAADDETVTVAIRMCLRGDCRKMSRRLSTRRNTPHSWYMFCFLWCMPMCW